MAAETSCSASAGSTLGQLDQPHHLQRVDMIGPHRQNFGVKPFGFAELALAVKRQSLRQRLRQVERGGLGKRLRHFG